MYRLRGKLVPTTEEEVEAAENRLKVESVELPAVLISPPAFPSRQSSPRPAKSSKDYWTNPSVRTLQSDDPLEAITRKAREVVLSAIERGWAGPPYDPSRLAELLKISEVVDARTSTKGDNFVIEFNPAQPPARLRFSLAHEIAHTFFPDCADAIRNRATHEEMSAAEWQLEMLCNVAASEILMPIGSLPDIDQFTPTFNSILKLRRDFQVSCEAILLRLLRLAGRECFAFAAHGDPASHRYRTDYVIKSRGFVGTPPFGAGFVLPKNSHAAECTAIGFTAADRANWLSLSGNWHIEYLGIAPYPGQNLPRVLSIVRPAHAAANIASNLHFYKGDATQPRGTERKILLQVVNDKARTWGPGFAAAVKKRWPSAEKQFTEWVMSRDRDFRLGGVHVVSLRDDLILASLVAQHGYGPSDKPRLRYGALLESLRKVAEVAKQQSATIHMPRIGSGLAGGDWSIVEGILQETLGTAGLDLTVYDLPNQRPPARRQMSLFDVPKSVDRFV